MYWEDKLYWVISYKSERVCYILINGSGTEEKFAPWTIWSDDSNSNWFANFPLDEHMKEIAWKNVDFCANCGSCPGGARKTIFGKEFNNVCRTTMRFINPDVEALECVKKMVEIRKNDIQCSRKSYNIIHIAGACGSGTSTLGCAIERKYGFKWLETDDYFHLPNGQFRSREERDILLMAEINNYPKCVISGSLANWGEVFIPRFDLVVYVSTATDIRIERLNKRQYERFGERICKGGDLYNNHINFIEGARNYDTLEQGRCKKRHEEWFKLLTCPLLRVDGTESVDVLLEKIMVGYTV